jgi:hypothetical protein
MKIPNWPLGKIQEGLVWGYTNKEKSTILGCISGIFKIFGGKGTPDDQSRKCFLVGIFSTHQTQKLCLELVFSSLLHLRDSQFWLKFPSLDKVLNHKVINSRFIHNLIGGSNSK